MTEPRDMFKEVRGGTDWWRVAPWMTPKGEGWNFPGSPVTKKVINYEGMSEFQEDYFKRLLQKYNAMFQDEEIEKGEYNQVLNLAWRQLQSGYFGASLPNFMELMPRGEAVIPGKLFRTDWGYTDSQGNPIDINLAERMLGEAYQDPGISEVQRRQLDLASQRFELDKGQLSTNQSPP